MGKDIDTGRNEVGAGRILARTGVGAVAMLALVLLCLAPDDDAPLTWAFWLTKAGGLALLLLTSWLYERFIKDGGEDDD